MLPSKRKEEGTYVRVMVRATGVRGGHAVCVSRRETHPVLIPFQSCDDRPECFSEFAVAQGNECYIRQGLGLGLGLGLGGS